MKQPRELFYLYIIFATVSNIVWTVRIAPELKLVFCSVLFIMVLTLAYLFIELEKLKVKN